MQGKRKDETGKKYGLLTVLKFSHVDGQALWKCQCECGNKAIVRGDHLRRGKVKSCGCQQGVIHGHSRRDVKTPEYVVWLSMNNRCRNPNAAGYYLYGGRGIQVCPRWQESFVVFHEDMGPRPSKGYMIERRDNDSGYEPDNCYWATPMQQAANTRKNTLLTINGKTQHIAAWCREVGIKPGCYQGRRRRGWSTLEALGFERRA